MDISDIELEESNIQKLNNLIDDYLCRRRNFDLSLKFGNGAHITCRPYKAHWLVTRFQDYVEVKEDSYNSFIEAFDNFKKMCLAGLREEIKKIDDSDNNKNKTPLTRIYLNKSSHNQETEIQNENRCS